LLHRKRARYCARDSETQASGFSPLRIAGRENNFCAFAQKNLGDGFADAHGGAGNDDDFILRAHAWL